MNHVHGEQKRYAVRGFLDGDALKLAQKFSARHMQIGADKTLADAVKLGGVDAGIQILAAPAGDLVELADLFVDGHARENGVDVCRLRQRRPGRKQKEDKGAGNAFELHPCFPSVVA